MWLLLLGWYRNFGLGVVRVVCGCLVLRCVVVVIGIGCWCRVGRC